MIKKKIIRYLRIIIDNADTAIAVICLIACIIISILGFFGISLSLEQNVFWILSLLPLITFMVFSKLRRIEKATLDKSKYFDNSEDVIYELMKICRQATDYIYVTGSRTKLPLLEHLEKTLEDSEINYRRFVTSKTHITPELVAHIERMKAKYPEGFRIMEMPNCPNFLVTESQVMLILPIPESGKFRGVLLTETSAVLQYVNYFNGLFFDGDSEHV